MCFHVISTKNEKVLSEKEVLKKFKDQQNKLADVYKVYGVAPEISVSHSEVATILLKLAFKVVQG